MNGNPAAALQQPSDQRTSPDRDAAVVEEAQLKRSQQRLTHRIRFSSDPVPEQVRQHNGIAGAGVPEGDQQAGFAPLLCTDGLDQLLRGVFAMQFQTLESGQHRQQPTHHRLHQTARPSGQPSQGRARGLG